MTRRDTEYFRHCLLGALLLGVGLAYGGDSRPLADSINPLIGASTSREFGEG